MRPGRLLAITPGDGRPLEDWLRALATGGIEEVLIREPALPAKALHDLARSALDDGLSVALHEGNPHAAAVCAVLGTSLYDRSRSCHTSDDVARTLDGGAPWVLFSPVWTPTSKPTDRRPVIGFDAFLTVGRGRPVLALGGVTPEHHRRLVRGGAAGSAVLGGLFGARDPAQATAWARQYLAL